MKYFIFSSATHFFDFMCLFAAHGQNRENKIAPKTTLRFRIFQPISFIFSPLPHFEPLISFFMRINGENDGALWYMHYYYYAKKL